MAGLEVAFPNSLQAALAHCHPEPLRRQTVHNNGEEGVGRGARGFSLVLFSGRRETANMEQSGSA